jgi:histidyl-tRNA synthetase
VGDEEVSSGIVGIKNMRTDEYVPVAFEHIAEGLRSNE